MLRPNYNDLPDLFSQWLALQQKKASTVENLTSFLKLLFKEKVELFVGSNIKEYLAQRLLSGTSTSHINNFVNCCRVFSHFCDEFGYEYDPILKTLPFLKDKYKARATMSVEEIQAFLQLQPKVVQARHPVSKKLFTHVVNPNAHNMWTMYFSIMAYTGMRTIEVASLKVDSVDFGRNIFNLVDTKTNEDRLVPIPKNLVSKVEEYVKQIKQGFLFPSKRPEGHVSSVEWGYQFHTRLKRLGISRPNLTPYSLRHSYITEMLQTEGVNIFDVKNLVGHHDTRTTEHYYHLTTKRLQRVSEKHPAVVSSDAQSVLVQINELLDHLELHRDARFKVKKEFGSNNLIFEVNIVDTN